MEEGIRGTPFCFSHLLCSLLWSLPVILSIPSARSAPVRALQATNALPAAFLV